MDIEIAAKALKELGHPIRLSIYKRLVKAGRPGMAVGKLQGELKIPNSTLSHHIASLASAQLLSQTRDGRTLYCQAEYEHFEALIEFLQAECCADQM